MDEKELKTSPKQRFFIILIAVLMLGSMLASYVAIIINGSQSSASSTTGQISDEKLAQYETEYADKLVAFQAATADDFSKFSKYLNAVGEYDKAAAEEGGVKTKDLLVGDGRELTEGDTDYLAYYVGWCSNGEVFDSSLDNASNATAFTNAIDVSGGVIEGWNTGVVGMKLGGVRRITIPSDLAYSDQREICDEYNQPLRFLIMPVESEESLKTMAAELQLAYIKWRYGVYYGIDYGAMIAQ